jgi:xanthine dehydrogenase iron-sulfur cluster and FAD-binding subunit A
MSAVPEDARIITIEGVENKKNLHPLQLAWIIHGGAQCGFCSPGFIVSAKALLDQNSNPTREEVRSWFQKNRNACRCTGYKQLVDAVFKTYDHLRKTLTGGVGLALGCCGAPAHWSGKEDQFKIHLETVIPLPESTRAGLTDWKIGNA